MQPGQPAREDDEYERHGTANLFLIAEPLQGQRHVKVTDQRTRIDFAHVIKEVVDIPYPEAEIIVLVMDNLNTHGPASLYEAFEPAEAKRRADKREIHDTPQHGSWLNMAEIELSVLSRQCWAQRIPNKGMLTDEAAAWEERRNRHRVRIDGRFTTADARIKLKRLYPSLLP
jgi:hypothetical protein